MTKSFLTVAASFSVLVVGAASAQTKAPSTPAASSEPSASAPAHKRVRHTVIRLQNKGEDSPNVTPSTSAITRTPGTPGASGTPGNPGGGNPPGR